MKIGLLLTSHPDPETSPYPHQSIHARVTDEVMTAEANGYDSVWIAEHHFSNAYGILPDPFSYLSYLAARPAASSLGPPSWSCRCTTPCASSRTPRSSTS